MVKVVKKAAKKAKVVSKKEIKSKVEEVKKLEISAKKQTKLAADMSKAQLIEVFGTKEGDTGSPEVQVAIATHKILNLTAHLEQNPKDNHSRRGLLKIISKRRRILNYLQEKDDKRFDALVKKIGLSK